ncbi:alpha/beta fold hydrolase [Brevundimonas sp.]|uniref:S9 family peptidase n=1 Tax=Brevundimonas sp. TaxID=1871086 RepID=UPI003AF7CF86
MTVQWSARLRGLLLAVVMALALPGLAAAQTVSEAEVAAPPPLAAYGALPSLELLQLSPSGERLAFISVAGEQRRLILMDLTTFAPVANVAVGAAKVRDLRWLGEDRVLIITTETRSALNLGIEDAEFAAGQVYNLSDGSVVPLLTRTRGMFPALLSHVTVVPGDGRPDLLVRAFSSERPQRVDLYRVDPDTGRARVTDTMFPETDDFVFDPIANRTVARSEYQSRTGEWTLLVRNDGGAFREAWQTIAPIDLPSLLGLGVDGDSVVVAADRPDLASTEDGDARFFEVDLETGEWRPVRLGFLPQSLWFHPATGRLIGAGRRDDDRQSYAFVDPDAQALWDRGRAALPEAAPVLVSWSEDFQRAILFTSGTGDSGTYYLLDLTTKTMSPIGAAYQDIAADQVAPIRPVTYAAADGLEIHGYLTIPPGIGNPRGLPLVVLAHGGPASRDVLGFDWWAQAIASRGFAVLQPNFRGSTGYGDAFLEAGYGEWGRKMQTDLSDGVRWLAVEGVIDPDRVCIVGASYGGYAAMAGPTLDPGVYRCAVSVNGVSDLRRMVEREARVRGERENETVRYWNRFMGAERLGDRSLDERSPARLAAQADAPMLLIHGRDDTVVPVDQSRLMAEALRRAGKPVELVELDGEDHWLSRSGTRLRMLTETLRFLLAHNPPD